MAASSDSVLQQVDGTEAPVDLLVLGCSQTDANTFSSTLRNAGQAVHIKSAETEAALARLIETEPWDLVLINVDSRSLPYNIAIDSIQHANPGAGMILLSNDPEQHLDLLVDADVRDLIQFNDRSRLVFTVQREHGTLLQKRELRRLTRKLRESEDRCAMLIDSSRDAIAYVHEGMHMNVNPVYLNMFGFEREDDMTGLPLMDLIAPAGRDRFKRILRDLDEDGHHEHEVSCQDVDGRTIEALMEFSPASIDGEACTQILIRDRSQQQALEQKIDELTNLDLQTGLFNRFAFMERLETLLRERQRDGGDIGLIHISASNIDAVRNNSGVGPADATLKEIAEVLENCSLATHTLARFGDHQFTIVVDGARDVTETAERCLSTLRSHQFREKGATLTPPAFAVGIVRIPAERDISMHEWVNRACRAGAQAELDGENQVVFYTDRMAEVATAQEPQNTELIEQIDKALEEDRFKLVFQPIVSLQGDTRENYSVLLRLPDANKEDILPGNFLSQANISNRLTEIDRWVIRNAIRELVSHRDQDKKINFHIMISRAGIEDDSILLWVCDCLREFKAKGAWLVFQFREADVRASLQPARALMEGLRKINCRIAIDHYVDGPDGDALLGHIPVDIVRLSPEYMQNLSTDAQQQDRLAGLNQQLQDKGIRTVATGVEDANSLAMLWNIGLNYIQGFFLQEPSETINYDADL